MTGCYPQRVSMHKIPADDHVLRPVSPYGLHPDEVTVAEILQKRGYATTLIGKWHLGDQPEFLPTQQGFDSYFGIPYSDDMTAREWKGRKWPPLPLMENESVVEAPVDRNTLTKRYTERAVQFIRENKSQPFFLFLSHAMPGSTKTPYASQEFQGRSQNGRWGDSVEEIDWSTGQILQTLQKLQLDKKTLVIWTSDNGAPSNPHNISRGTNQPLAGRGYTTTEGGMRVPTIAWWPEKIPAGTTCGELATTMDLLPTFAALAGAEADSTRIRDGHNISPLLLGPDAAKSPYEFFFYYQGNQLQAVRNGRHKLWIPLEKPLRHGRFRKGPTPMQLFDVVADARCENDLLAQTQTGNVKLLAQRMLNAARDIETRLGTVNQRGREQRNPGRVPNPTARVR